MSAFDTGAAAMLRKLIFGARADIADSALPPEKRAGKAPSTASLPAGISGGEDFAQHDDTEAR